MTESTKIFCDILHRWATVRNWDCKGCESPVDVRLKEWGHDTCSSPAMYYIKKKCLNDLKSLIQFNSIQNEELRNQKILGKYEQWDENKVLETVKIDLGFSVS